MTTHHPDRSFARPVACALVFALVAGHAPPVAAAGTDPDAGTWRMVVMTSPAELGTTFRKDSNRCFGDICSRADATGNSF